MEDIYFAEQELEPTRRGAKTFSLDKVAILVNTARCLKVNWESFGDIVGYIPVYSQVVGPDGGTVTD